MEIERKQKKMNNSFTTSLLLRVLVLASVPQVLVSVIVYTTTVNSINGSIAVVSMVVVANGSASGRSSPLFTQFLNEDTTSPPSPSPIDIPVMIRKFDSGVMVIQNKSHSDEEVFERIKSLASKPDALRTGISPSDAAITLGIAPAMAKEQLLTAESKGLLCRDISPEGFRFYSNLFAEIDLTDIYSVKDHGIYKIWVSLTISACG